MSALEERIDLIEKILANRVTKATVVKEIQRLEEAYGKDAFSVIVFRSKPKPWNEEYYEDLKQLSLAGEDSKEYILHLVEVRDELYGKGASALADFFKTHKIAVVICAIIVVIIIALLSRG